MLSHGSCPASSLAVLLWLCPEARQPFSPSLGPFNLGLSALPCQSWLAFWIHLVYRRKLDSTESRCASLPSLFVSFPLDLGLG